MKTFTCRSTFLYGSQLYPASWKQGIDLFLNVNYGIFKRQLAGRTLMMKTEINRKFEDKRESHLISKSRAQSDSRK